MTASAALNWVNGEWIDSGTHQDSVNPATGEVIGRFAVGGRDQFAAGIKAAKAVFEESSWKRDRMLRARVLNQMADIFEKNTEALVEQLALENGKTKYEAMFEVSMVPPKLRYFASLVRTQFGRAHQPDDGKYAVVLREAIGVAGVIVPWNSPVVLLVRSLAPALAAGATAVVKMPAQIAQTSALLCRLLDQVEGLPKGAVNIIVERGDEGARLLVDSPDIAAISYTGSTHVGRKIAEGAAKTLKRLNLELGGKTPMIVFDDANLDRLVPTLEKGITVFAGQFCMTGSRILVQRGIADQVRELLVARLEAVKVGPASDPTSDMGAMIDKDTVARVDAVVRAAIDKGAKALVRGGPVTEGPLARGAFYAPTLLEVDDPDADIVLKETFGPVATLQVFDTEDEAVKLANHSEYGLAASIWTGDVERPWRVAQGIQAGTIWINEWAVVHDECEEGGFKQSGLGRLNGVAALDTFTEYKLVTISVGAGPT